MKRFFTFIAFVIITAAVATDVLFAWYYVNLRFSLRILEQQISRVQQHRAAALFLKLLISNVLRGPVSTAAQGEQPRPEITFEERFLLEQSVREIGDSVILVQWQKFAAAGDPRVAQEHLAALLEAVVEEMKEEKE